MGVRVSRPELTGGSPTAEAAASNTVQWGFESSAPDWPISSADRAPRSYRGGRGRNSRMGFYVFVAQWSERPAVNRLVEGSNPSEYAYGGVAQRQMQVALNHLDEGSSPSAPSI